jgi:nucleoside-diphosphate-sugar epimerase
MGTIMVTGGLGFVGRHLIGMLVAEGSLVVSYNRDFSTSESAAVTTVQGELFDVPRLVRALHKACASDCSSFAVSGTKSSHELLAVHAAPSSWSACRAALLRLL